MQVPFIVALFQFVTLRLRHSRAPSPANPRQSRARHPELQMQQQPQNQSTSRSTTAVVSSPVAISQSQPHKLASMTPREWAGHPPKLPAVKCGSVIEAIPAPRNRCRQLGRRRLGFADGQLTLCTTSKLFPRENGDLLGACKFLLHLLRVDEFVATRFTGVEPGHDCFRLRGPTLRETEHGVVSWLR